MKTTFADRVLDYHFGLEPELPLPSDVQLLYPYHSEEVRKAMRQFFRKYFSDNQSRFALLGINPGRFGAGITGTPFTDPIRLEEICGIKNNFKKRQELSSVFVYSFISALGGPDEFYKNFYITSISPLGFTKNGKNYNYYDSKELEGKVMPLIEENLAMLISTGVSDQVAFSMGQGKNFKFLLKLNARMKYFAEVVPLPHPRWVMQYRLKRKEEFVMQYVRELSKVLPK